jgi:hypothetical protein
MTIKTIGVQSTEELVAFLATLGNGYLFRGQTGDHRDAAGLPSIKTSFSRHGCHPPLMLRWSHYARAILRAFAKGFDNSDDLATDQAILQHYGWRSFFVDATSSPDVASWFAGHKFATQRKLDLTEDCWETGLFTVRDAATYEPADGLAVLYCLSKKRLRAHGLQTVELSEIATTNGRPRFIAQHAWMVGPLQTPLAADCITAKILAPASIFRDYAASKGLRTTADLFPGPDEDPVLAALLAMPWVHYDDGASPDKLAFYFRSLPIPEYGWPFVKIHASSVAFYRPFWLANECPSDRPPFPAATYPLSPETMFYGFPGDTRAFQNLSLLLSQHPFLVAEMDGLMDHPHTGPTEQYCKGVFLERIGDLVHLGEVAMSHPGMQPSECGRVRGRHYRICTDGSWAREPHPDDCPCGHDALHKHHLAVATHLENELAQGAFRRVKPNALAHRDVDAALCLDHIKDQSCRNEPYFSDLMLAR